jgi:hypothetical protein
VATCPQAGQLTASLSAASPRLRYGAWQAAVAPPPPAGLLEEQVKLDDAGASMYLVNALAQDGRNGLLR